MSTWDSCYMASHPAVHADWPGLNAANMAGRGWLDEVRVWNAPAAVDAIVTLRPLVRFDLPGTLAARVGPYFVELRINEAWDAAIPGPAVLIAIDRNNHRTSCPRQRPSGPSKGDVFESGSPSVPFIPWRRVEVSDIDPVGRKRDSARHHPTRHIYSFLGGAFGEYDVFAGPPGEGNGFAVIGGSAIPIPPQSRSSKILAQLVSMHAAEFALGDELDEAHRSDAWAAIRRLLPSETEEHEYTSPAPRSTEAQIQLGATNANGHGTAES